MGHVTKSISVFPASRWQDFHAINRLMCKCVQHTLKNLLLLKKTEPLMHQQCNEVLDHRDANHF
jgi:hypothetical protein